MNPIQAFKLFRDYEKAQDILKEKVTPMNKTIQIIHLLATAAAVIGVPTMDEKWLRNPEHAGIFGLLLAISAFLHAVSPSVFGAPPSQPQPPTDGAGSNLGKAAILILGLLLIPATLKAQTIPEAPAPQVQNLYAGGVSYSVGASPAIAGTGLYAHAVSNEGLYAFTVVDALPNTLKPFTVSTNVGVGIAQKLFTIEKVPVYAPTAAGISWSGGNTGWQWNGGIIASIHIRSDYYILPSVRFLKSSVSGGTGYQPIIGVLFGWGK